MAVLRLVETAEIVKLEPNRFDDGWKLLPDTMKKRSDSRAKVRKVWDMHAKRCGGQDKLLAALRTYLSGDKDLPKSGGPGLQVWLRAEKYDHWMPDEASIAMAETPPYPQRPALIKSLGEPFVKSYIDSGTVHDDGFITPRTDYAKGKLMEKARELKQAGIAGIRSRQ